LEAPLLPFTYRTVRWKKCVHFTVLVERDLQLPAMLVDFGEDGLGADLPEELPIGTVVTAAFRFREEDKPTLIAAEVVRVDGIRHGFAFLREGQGTVLASLLRDRNVRTF
jgi:hypothetical protein